MKKLLLLSTLLTTSLFMTSAKAACLVPKAPADAKVIHSAYTHTNDEVTQLVFARLFNQKGAGWIEIYLGNRKEQGVCYNFKKVGLEKISVEEKPVPAKPTHLLDLDYSKSENKVYIQYLDSTDFNHWKSECAFFLNLKEEVIGAACGG